MAKKLKLEESLLRFLIRLQKKLTCFRAMVKIICFVFEADKDKFNNTTNTVYEVRIVYTR